MVCQLWSRFITPGGTTGSLGGGAGAGSGGVGNVGGYGSHYPPPPSLPTMEGATALDPAEMKYSCTMDFRSQGKTIDLIILYIYFLLEEEIQYMHYVFTHLLFS